MNNYNCIKSLCQAGKSGRRKNKNSVRFFGLVYEEILGIANKKSGSFCGIDRGNSVGSFTSCAAFHCIDGSGAVDCTPDSEGCHKEGKSAVNKNFRIGDISKIACARNAENADDSCCCQNLKDKIQNICSFHFITSFPDVYMGCVR